MSDYNLMDVQSRALEQNFVYYQRLWRTYPQLFQNIKSRLYQTRQELENVKTDGSKVRNMAQAELNKEISALQNVFHISIPNTVVYDKDFYNHLINAINRCIGIKQVYERNVLLVQNTKGQKSVISFFPTYLRKQLQHEFTEEGRLSKKVINQWAATSNTSIEEVVKEILDQELPNIVQDAIMRMLSEQTNVENKAIDQEYRTAYQQLYDELALFSQQKTISPLTKEIYDIYHVDELKQLILDKVIRSNSTSKIRKNSQLNKKLQADFHARGGYTLEAIGNAVANMMLDGIKGGSVHTGNVRVEGNNHGHDTGMKADYIITLNIDTMPVEEMIAHWTDESGEVSRQKSVEKIQKLYDEVKDIDNGFIIYSSAKNYTYNEKFGGFSAGNALSMDNFKEVMKNVGWKSNFNMVVGAILQIADGAIGANVLDKADLENLLARNVAYLLFDDVDQIGIENQSGTNTLHVMNLNGIYIPISLILFSLADAIDEANESTARNLIRVTLTNQPILFKTAAEQRKWEEQNDASPYDAWVHQRTVALNNTKVQAHFLKNFQEIIQTYITKFER